MTYGLIIDRLIKLEKTINQAIDTMVSDMNEMKDWSHGIARDLELIAAISAKTELHLNRLLDGEKSEDTQKNKKSDHTII
jgi:hypothetical protein